MATRKYKRKVKGTRVQNKKKIMRKSKRKSKTKRKRKTKRKSKVRRSRSNLPCNKVTKSNRTGKKFMVKACSGGREKLIHFGATGYGHNYSQGARRSFRARHKCHTAKDKLTARYWSCKHSWTKGGSKKRCPKGRKCKY